MAASTSSGGWTRAWSLGWAVAWSSACVTPPAPESAHQAESASDPVAAEVRKHPSRVENRLSLGWHHSCVIDDDGGLGCWGSALDLPDLARGVAGLEPPVLALNSRFGQEGCVVVGDGRVRCWDEYEPSPWYVEELDDALDRTRSCALRRTGEVGCGLGPGRSTSMPVAEVLEVAETIHANDRIRCLRTSAGLGLCRNFDRGIALGSPDLDTPPYDDVFAIAVGRSVVWIARADGHVERCTMPVRDCVQVNEVEDVVELDAAEDLVCARTSAGRVHCWLGEPDDWYWSVLAELGYWDLHSPTEVAGIEDAVEIAVEAQHACARLRDGSVRCWGDNRQFQLGDPHGRDHHRTPQRVATLPRIEQVAVGNRHVCARDDEGEVWCWGWRFFDDRDPFDFYDRPERLPRETDAAVVRLLAGYDLACSIHADGHVTCVGEGPDPFHFDGASMAAPELDATSVVDLSDGWGCIARKPGVACFGDVRYHPSDFDPQTTWRIRAPIAGRVVGIGIGETHGCALVDDGRVYCWSGSDTGVLVTVPRLVSLDAGAAHTCGLDRQGRAWCWTPNQPGTEVAGLPFLTSIAAGDVQTCALDQTGSVWCWGPDGGPERLEGLPPIRQLDTATETTCAVDHEGDVWCWGRNDERQASIASPAYSVAAVEVSADRIIPMVPR